MGRIWIPPQWADEFREHPERFDVWEDRLFGNGTISRKLNPTFLDRLPWILKAVLVVAVAYSSYIVTSILW